MGDKNKYMQNTIICLNKESMICTICLEIPRNPIECIQCCQLFCIECIYAWYDKSNNYYCPYRCEFGSLRKVQGALEKIIKSALQNNPNLDRSNHSEEDMDIIKEHSTDLKLMMQNRDKIWIEAVKN